MVSGSPDSSGGLLIKSYVDCHQTLPSFLGCNVTAYLLFLGIFYIVTLAGKRKSKIGSSHIHSPRQSYLYQT